MQNRMPENRETVTFEISDEVREKMEHAQARHVLIEEKSVSDLSYVDVSRSYYHGMKRLHLLV